MTELDLDPIMRDLASERRLFHSEADFQHALAWKIHEWEPKAKIRLEVSSGRFDKRERIDILVRTSTLIYAIELKYKKSSLKGEWGGERFSLSKDGAQDIGRYDFIKDLARLERYVSAEANVIGYAVLLTNDNLYWRESVRGLASAAFFLHESRVIDCGSPLAWHENTGAGTMRGRNESFTLLTSRTLSWKDYSHIPDVRNGTFRYLALKVANTVQSGAKGFVHSSSK